MQPDLIPAFGVPGSAGKLVVSRLNFQTMEQRVHILPLPWTFAQKLAFRVAFIFFLWYMFYNSSGLLPYAENIFAWYITPFHQLIQWTGNHILQIPYTISVEQTGSGDTAYDYVALLFVLVISLAGACVWTALDQRRKHYRQLYHWLRVMLRYYLAFTMLVYGVVKIYKLQFPFPDPWRLQQAYGESSPMGLAWTFLGYSKGYNYFTGGTELLGALLLLFRRTTTLGSVITLAVMINVMVMNFCYDIPVKLFSAMLVIMTLFILGRDMGRLTSFFITNQPLKAADIRSPFVRKRAMRRLLVTGKVLLIAYVLTGNVISNASMLSQYGDYAPKPALYGIYNVETFVCNNDTIPPLLTDTIRWKQFIVCGWQKYPFVFVKGMNDSLHRLEFRPDTSANTVVLFPRSDTANKNHLSWSYPDKDHLALQGHWKGDSIYVRMRIYDLNKFLLKNRGFHWINEYPYNR